MYVIVCKGREVSWFVAHKQGGAELKRWNVPMLCLASDVKQGSCQFWVEECKPHECWGS